MTSPRALVTGIAGFTGYFLSNALENVGYDVYGLGAKPADLPNYYQIDLSDTPRLEALIAEIKPNVVIHLAAIAFVDHGDPSDFYKVNLIGTRNLLSALANSNFDINCVLLVSSANVYGNANSSTLTETHDPCPENDYAVSKLAMEHMAKLWIPKLPIVIVRPFNYTGVGQSSQFLLPKIVSHFRLKATQIELGNLDVWRDFSDVRSVVEAYVGLIQQKPIGQILNVCSGQVTSLREIVSMVEELAGYRIEIMINPAFVRPQEIKILKGSAEQLTKLLPSWRSIPIKETLSWMYSEPQR